MNKKIHMGIRIILSIVFTILFQMNIDMNVLPKESFYSKDRVLEVLLFIAFFCSFKVWENNKYSYKKWCLIAAGILAGFYVLGYNIEKYLDIFSDINFDWILGKLFLKWLVLWYTLSTILLYVYLKWEKSKFLSIDKKISTVPKWVRQICIMLVFVLCWIPQLINNFPGIIYADSWNQIYQALGVEPLTTHHPITHTLFLKLCLMGNQDIEKGILLYTLISFFVITFLLAYTINLMIEEEFDIRFVILSIFVYIMFPSMPMFTIAIIKDGWFAAFVGLFLIELYATIINKKTGIRYYTGLTIASLGVGLFRKNGIYLLIFSCVYLLIYMFIAKDAIQRTLIICFFAVCINVGVEKGAVLGGIQPGSPREMLSLPIQQMARIDKNIQNIDTRLKSEIYSYFEDKSNLGEAYEPIISDNAKSLFSEKNFYGREKEFIKLSLHLLMTYPEESLEAFMCNSFGYWYPIAINWYYAENNSEELDIETIVKNHEYPININYVYYNEIKNIIGIDLFSSIGIIFWLFIAISGYIIANKQYKELTILVPMGALWLTSIASPVYNELRYVLAIYPALPIVCQLIIKCNLSKKIVEVSAKNEQTE